MLSEIWIGFRWSCEREGNSGGHRVYLYGVNCGEQKVKDWIGYCGYTLFFSALGKFIMKRYS